MSETTFTPNSFNKGRFTIESSGDSRAFSLNPNDIKDTKGMGYASFDVPGISHPILQAGSGSERVISFTLRLDGDVGYRGIRRAQRRVRTRNLVGHSVIDEILWYRQFVYTEGNARLGLPGAQPEVILFSFGTLYQGTRCVMRRCDYAGLQWSSTLEPTRGDLTIELVEKILSTVLRSSIWAAGTNQGF